MASLKKGATLQEWQEFANEVYGPANRRHFLVTELMTNVERFAMRGLKGIRKNDADKAKKNLLTAMSWYLSMLNQWDIDLADAVWNRFPYVCSYCGNCPCVCKAKKIQKRVRPNPGKRRKPKSIVDFQRMISDIYPPEARTLEHAGIHLAEEIGELSEAVLRFRGNRIDRDFDHIVLEAADTFSCFIGVLNSMDISLETELVRLFKKGCHACHHTPCTCDYQFIIRYDS